MDSSCGNPNSDRHDPNPNLERDSSTVTRPRAAAAQSHPSSPSTPRQDDPCHGKVFVGGFPWATTSEGLRQHFEKHGEVREAFVVRDRLSGRSRGFGFVTFGDSEAAKRALSLKNPVIGGRISVCDTAKPPQVSISSFNSAPQFRIRKDFELLGSQDRTGGFAERGVKARYLNQRGRSEIARQITW